MTNIRALIRMCSCLLFRRAPLLFKLLSRHLTLLFDSGVAASVGSSQLLIASDEFSLDLGTEGFLIGGALLLAEETNPDGTRSVG